MKTDGCGGHGKDSDDKWIRDESCESCHRWDWQPVPASYVHALADMVCIWNRCGHIHWDSNDPRHETDDSYSLMKREWRYATSLLHGLADRNLILTEAPLCTCGVQLGDEIHQDITTFEKGVSSKLHPDQHPYDPPLFS